MWPEPSPRSAFTRRRQRLDALLPGPKLLSAGLPRPRNFAHNPYPFRAESHFLYLVGRGLEGALLVVDGERTTLYAEPPQLDDALWFGPKPSLAALSGELEIAVRPLSEFEAPDEVALLPPQDAESAFDLADRVGRDVEAGGGDAVSGRDAALAEAMIELRLRHDDAAVAQLRQAAAVTTEAHREGRDATRPGRREASVRAAMEHAIIEHGMTTAYGSIVTVHGEVLHANDYHRELRPGDLLLADVGAETPEGFAGDVTRVWPVTGRFSPTQRIAYEVVLAAQHAAIDAVRPGVRYRDVHRAAGLAMTRALADAGLFVGDPEELYARGAASLFFPHGVGHLLGLDVHDMEDLGDRAGYAPGRTRSSSRGERYLRLDRDLEPGMCVTIEPGFYRIPALLDDPDALGDLRRSMNFSVLEQLSDVRGIRIEDDVLVTDDGAEVLTARIPKRIEDVERS
ncbi:MAG TPA: aminopeptidase P family protein [Polyangiaceae bacterium]|jgi:Xaa-Pro aminopeptidase|nr:aminopeptidase P family protein [Polyangiaceae bacterium]